MMRQLKISVAITARGGEALERYLQEISREPMVTPDEEADLARQIQMGEAVALDRLVRANFRFVV